jgi:2-iminobutanoate/2-iminopropanoate deaminase
MQNMKAVLQEAGMTFEHIVKTTIFIIDMSDFAKINTVYGSYFNEKTLQLETVQVSCLKNVNINFYDCNL